MTIRKRVVSVLLIAVLTMAMVFETAMPSFAFSTFKKKSPFSKTGYSTYYHNKSRFNGYTVVNGVDVSEFQSASKSSFSTAKKKGVDFAIIRVSGTYYGKSDLKMYEDDGWKTHFKNARSAGVMTGLYHFSQAKTETEARKEADKIVNCFVAGIKEMYGSSVDPRAYLDMPIYMDYEFQSGCRIKSLSKSQRTKNALAFCKRIEENGYSAGVYASTYFLFNSVSGADIGKTYDIWAAQYWKKNEYDKSNYSKWQYSSSARISGIRNSKGKTTNVDVNFWYLKKSRTVSDKDALDIANCTISAEPKSIKYTGKTIKPTVSVTYKGTKLVKGTDYTVGYIRNVKPGTSYIYIRGIGKYSGYKLVYFAIAPVVPKSYIKKVSGKKKSFYVTWKKKSSSDIDGYQIQYSRSEDMSGNAKKTIKSYKKTSKTIKTKYRKSKYYVRVRTYKKVDGITYYSNWSGKKKVTTK